jgi:hypothetical protein
MPFFVTAISAVLRHPVWCSSVAGAGRQRAPVRDYNNPNNRNRNNGLRLAFGSAPRHSPQSTPAWIGPEFCAGYGLRSED